MANETSRDRMDEDTQRLIEALWKVVYEADVNERVVDHAINMMRHELYMNEEAQLIKCRANDFVKRLRTMQESAEHPDD